MLLIHCPYCDEDRPELEFAYAGEAHIARPADPLEPHRRGVARLPLHPHQPARPPLRALAPHQRLRPLLQRGARDRLRPLPLDLQGGRAPPRHRQPDGRHRMTSHRLPNRGRVDHGEPVRFSFDGKSYQGLAGDTLASALLANGVHLMGRSFKYHRPRGVVSAGSDEPNALDRHPPRPRPLRAEHPRHDPGAPRRPRGDQPEPLALARLRRRRDQRPLRLAVLGRLLLQDLHVAARLLGPRLRADHPQRRRPRRLADRARRRPLRQPLRPHRRARRRRRPRRPRRRASPPAAPAPTRHARRRDRRARRLAALRARRRHRRQARLGLARRRPSPSSPRSRTSR